MAFTEGNSNGALNGTTPVTVVAAPAASTRRLVKQVRVHNRDTASVTVTINLVDGVNTRRLSQTTLGSGKTLLDLSTHCLDTTSKSITAVLSGAAATTNPDYSATWADAS